MLICSIVRAIYFSVSLYGEPITCVQTETETYCVAGRWDMESGDEHCRTVADEKEEL